MKGYYKRPDATAESIKNGWFSTGDIAHRDTDGFYFITDHVMGVAPTWLQREVDQRQPGTT